ncbi:MAG: hypothetical protein WCP03_00775 [Candidatus Saccharibacteria bacterium]
MQPFIDYFTNTPKSKLIARALILLIVTVVVVLAISFFWNYFVTQKIVTLSPSAGTTITIGRQNGDDPYIGHPIATTTSQKKIRLQPGAYLVKFSGSEDYQEELTGVVVDKTIEIKTPDLKYTTNKQSQLLKSNKSAITKALSPIIPSGGYQINKEELLGGLDWYAASLKPNPWCDWGVPVKQLVPMPTSCNYDMLRVILKKENGQWKVVAKPAIIFAIADYPDIPQDIIRATNKLGFTD